jgi:hypothetical protein
VGTLMRSALPIAVAAFCLFLGACGNGKVYPKPLSAMHDALAEVDELPPVFGSAAPAVSVDSSDPANVKWVVELDGSEVMRFVAKLEAEDDKSTRMVLELVGAKQGPRGDVEKRLEEHPELRHLYLVAMTEEIESKLEGRKFDASRTYAALAAATAANIGSISRQMDAAGEADRKRDEQNIRNAYAEEAAGN